MVYFHITVRKTRDELQPHIVLQEQEVSASAWFNKDLVKLAIGQRNGFLNNNEDLIKERNVPSGHNEKIFHISKTAALARGH